MVEVLGLFLKAFSKMNFFFFSFSGRAVVLVESWFPKLGRAVKAPALHWMIREFQMNYHFKEIVQPLHFITFLHVTYILSTR